MMQKYDMVKDPSSPYVTLKDRVRFSRLNDIAKDLETKRH